MQPNAPIIPPAQVYFVFTVVTLVLLAFGCMIVLKIAIFLAEKRAGVEYRWEPPAPTQPGPIRRWMEAHAADVEARYTPRRYVLMSNEETDENESVSDPVYIPVLDTGMPKTDIPGIPDMDAKKPFSRDITANEWIVWMSVARGDEGKRYRFSANQIHAAVGGDRNTVLATIKEIRGGPPTPEFRQPDGSTAPAEYPITK